VLLGACALSLTGALLAFAARQLAEGGAVTLGALSGVLLLATCEVLAARLARQVTAPVQAVSAALERLGETRDFTARVRPAGPEELDRLAESFNGMAASLAEREQAQAELPSQLATFDPLTRLPNRALFADRLKQAVLRATRAGTHGAVLFIDLDGFKEINDRHGHRTGDQLLQEVARRLAAITRQEDTLARQGGDEFTILLQDVKQPGNALQVARKHAENLRAPWDHDGQRIFISASVGVALFPEHGQDAEELLQSADAAMYQAKRLGKDNAVLFSQGLRQELSDRHALAADLARALGDRALALHYQPRFSLARETVTAVEALLRWQHPVLGPLDPGRFVPLAEQSGLVLPLGEWVLREACRQLGQWRRDGAPLPRVAVNLAPAQLHRQDLAAILGEALAEHALDPHMVELEVQEAALMANLEQSRKVLGPLKQLGVRISVDDFGAGYSSLGLLRTLPVAILKVDRSFVHRLHESREDRQMFAAILAMAGSLGLEVVAEGVETAAQREALLGLGCAEAQGWFFAPPMPAHLLPAWFQAGPRGEEARRHHPSASGRSYLDALGGA
jgi:diguanylate cyclase (GGDEF)-like protein